MAAPAQNPEAALGRLMQLRVRLRPHARIHRHEYRGQPWFVIEDPASGRAHRVSPSAREVLGHAEAQMLEPRRVLRADHHPRSVADQPLEVEG